MTFQGVISALDIAPIDGSSACELNLFNWEDVEPTSGLPRFDLSPEVVAVETIDCPDPGTSVPLDVDLFVASPYVDLVRVGLFLIVDTPDVGTGEFKAAVNPVFVDAETTVTGVDFQVTAFPIGGGDGDADGGGGGPSATFSGEIDAGSLSVPSDAFCELVLWDWEGVHPGSGMADFTSDEYLIAVEEVDCPETGGVLPTKRCSRSRAPWVRPARWDSSRTSREAGRWRRSVARPTPSPSMGQTPTAT